MESAWIAAWITSVIAIVSASAAVWSARNGNRTLKRAEADAQARSRPMVVAELRDDPYALATQLLVIKNYGQTVARNVTVTFKPPLGDPTPEQAHESVAPFLKKRYARPIPILVPGAELDNVYFVGRAESGGWQNIEPFPDQVAVTISCVGPNGATYTEVCNLDVDVIHWRTYVKSSTDPTQQMKDMKKNLAGINQAITQIAQTLTKFTGVEKQKRIPYTDEVEKMFPGLTAEQLPPSIPRPPGESSTASEGPSAADD